MICNGIMRSTTNFTIDILENNAFKGPLPFNCSAFIKVIPEYFACSFKKNEGLEECINLPDNLHVFLNFGGKRSIFEQYTDISKKLWTPLFFSLMGEETMINNLNIKGFLILDKSRNPINNLFSINRVIAYEFYAVPLNPVATLFKESEFITWREDNYLRIRIGVTDYFRFVRNKMIFSSVFQNNKEISKYYPVGLVTGFKFYEMGIRNFEFSQLGESLNKYYVYLPSYSTKLAIYYPQGYGQIFIIKIEKFLIDAIPSFVQNNYLIESKPDIDYFFFNYLIFNMNGKIDFMIPLNPNIILTFEMTKNFNETIFKYQGNIVEDLRFYTYFQGDREDFLTVMIRINGTGFFNLQYKNFEMENFENIEPNNIIYTNSIETSAFTSVCSSGYTSFEEWSCLQSCSSFYFSPLNICQDKCTDLSINGNKCECPPNNPFYYYTNNLTCTSKCPNSYPNFNLNMECVKACPYFILYPSKICVDKCDSTLTQNSNCTCPSDKPFHYISDSGEIVCETKCPTYKPFFNNDYFCLNSCSILWFDPLKLCVDSCGTNLIKNGDHCECPKDKPSYHLNEKLEIICVNDNEDNTIRTILLSVLIPISTLILSSFYFYRRHKKLALLKKKKGEKKNEKEEDLENFEEKDPFCFIEEPKKKYRTSYILDNRDLNLNFKTTSKFKETKKIQIRNSQTIDQTDEIEEVENENEFDPENFQGSTLMSSSGIKTDEDLIKKWKDQNIFYEIIDCEDVSQLGPFQLKKVDYLGQGGEGQIYKVQNRYKECFAYKCFADNVKRIKIESLEFQKLEKELDLFKKLNNPLLVYADGVIYEKTNNLISYGIKIDLMDLNLRQFIEKDRHKQSSFETKLQISIQIINAIKNIHYKNVVHYDLKPENILLEKEKSGGFFNIKISDFGLAQEVTGDNDAFEIRGITFLYSSPEYLLGFLKSKISSSRIYYKPNFKDDIWSFGLILHDIFLGEFEEKLPYLKFLESYPDGDLTEENIEEVRTSIFEGSTTFSTSSGIESYDKIYHIINECLQIDSEKRPDAEQVREMLGQNQ